MGRDRVDSTEDAFETMYESCLSTSWGHVWFVVDYVTLATGVLANAVLLFLFLRERKTLSASQVLGMNLVIMNLMYLTVIPVDVASRTRFFATFNTTQNIHDVFGVICRKHTQTGDRIATQDVKKALSTFLLIGTPLLLTCMCLERHLAVSRPVLYMKIREKKYRLMVSAVVSVITVGFAVTSRFLNNIEIIISVSVIISFLFVVMLLSLGTMVQSLLWHTAHHDPLGNKARPDSPQKRQVVQSLLTVVVSATLVYLPVLSLSPFILYINNNREASVSAVAICNVFQCSLLFPRFGVLIGPLFFFSKAKQMFKFKKRSNSA